MNNSFRMTSDLLNLPFIRVSNWMELKVLGNAYIEEEDIDEYNSQGPFSPNVDIIWIKVYKVGSFVNGNGNDSHFLFVFMSNLEHYLSNSSIFFSCRQDKKILVVSFHNHLGDK